MQSEFIAHALRKPRGYAGDAELMNIIYENRDRGATPFAVLTNRVYQTLPAAAAVRRRSAAIERHLRSLPNTAKILNLACGPGREIREWLKDAPPGVRVDLLDHDIKTIFHTRRTIADDRVRHFVANAFQIIKGNLRVAQPRKAWLPLCNPATDFRGVRALLTPLKYRVSKLQQGAYDFVYSAGLYDYVDQFPNNPERGVTALTKRLFALLKPGGQLLVGNFLQPEAESNPHRRHHRLMMELYSDWVLLYRTKAQIRQFLAGLPEGQFEYRELNEDLRELDGAPSSIGFLLISRLA